MTWRDQILDYFTEPLPPILLISDPDGLLLDETILLQLEKKKIALLPFEDRAKFRYLYERYYRDQQGKSLLIHVRDHSVDHLPFDLVQKGQPITLRIGHFFPHFPSAIISQLDKQALDALYLHSQGVQGPLTLQEAYDFLLRRVYKLAYDSVDSVVEFLRLLIKKHESPYSMPDELERFLIDHFQKAPYLRSFPIAQLVSSPIDFYQYVEQEWHHYVQTVDGKGEVARETFQDEYHGSHPFAHTQLRHDLTRLFIEGKIESGEKMADALLLDWGMYHARAKVNARDEAKLKLLLNQLEEKLTESPTYKHWMEIVPLLAEAQYLCTKDDLDETQLIQLRERYEEQFQNWMLTEYQTLANLPYLHAPVMVHHIPHFLRLKRKDKVALIVIDGMGFMQWKQIKTYLNRAFQCYERGVYAWVPTLTSVSRQALFSGELPFHFADSIHSTHKEASLWQLFWEQQEVPKLRISFEKGLGQGSYQAEGVEAVKNPSIKVAGLVIDTIDRLMHGAIQGYKGLLAEMEVWLQTGYLEQLIQDLVVRGFDVYLTADHGNTASTGIGRPNEGVLAETRGERVRIYRDQKLRDQAALEYSSICWPQIALPQDWFVLLAKSGEAFVREGEQVISHGGITMAEVIVPFVQIRPKPDVSEVLA